MNNPMALPIIIADNICVTDHARRSAFDKSHVLQFHQQVGVPRRRFTLVSFAIVRYEACYVFVTLLHEVSDTDRDATTRKHFVVPMPKRLWKN